MIFTVAFSGPDQDSESPGGSIIELAPFDGDTVVIHTANPVVIKALAVGRVVEFKVIVADHSGSDPGQSMDPI